MNRWNWYCVELFGTQEKKSMDKEEEKTDIKKQLEQSNSIITIFLRLRSM